jgi:hypothetical protein
MPTPIAQSIKFIVNFFRINNFQVYERVRVKEDMKSSVFKIWHFWNLRVHWECILKEHTKQFHKRTHHTLSRTFTYRFLWRSILIVSWHLECFKTNPSTKIEVKIWQIQKNLFIAVAHFNWFYCCCWNIYQRSCLMINFLSFLCFVNALALQLCKFWTNTISKWRHNHNSLFAILFWA